MEVILFFGLIAVAYYLGSKLNKLESRIDTLEGHKPLVSPALTPIPVSQSATAQPTPVEDDHELKQLLPSNQSSAVGQFIAWVQRDFMVKMGSLLLLLGLGWFVSYAFANNWIGPAGRITLGLLFGAGILALGTVRIRRFVHQGGIFTVVGAAVVLLTVFAAREIYNFFTPVSALFLMFITVIFVAFVAVRYQSEKLAFASLLLGSIAPFLTAAPTNDVTVQFTYLMILVFGTLWVVWMTGWTKLTITAVVITYLYSLPFLVMGKGEQDVVITFSFLFVSIFFITNLVSLVRRRFEGKQHKIVHALTAIGSAIFLVTWIEAAVNLDWKSLIYVAWALVFALGSYVVYYFTANWSAFYIYGSTSVALLGIATAAELNGPTLTVAYLLEIGFLIMVVAKLTDNSKLLARLSWLLFIPLMMSLDSLDSSLWRDSVFHEDFVVLSLTASVFFMVGLLMLNRQKSAVEDNNIAKITAVTLMTIAGFYVLSLVWLISHAVLTDDFATTVSLMVYTVIGIAMFVLGKIRDGSYIKLGGSIIIGSVVLRLLFIDIWDMNLEGRIITFLIIGVMLISTAFIGRVNQPDDEQSNQNIQ